MPVSNQRQKMALAAADNLDNTYGEIVQAVVNAAWNKFDPEDKSTWPDGERYHYICLHRNGRVIGKAWQIDKWDFITHWADPNDLLFVQGRENNET